LESLYRTRGVTSWKTTCLTFTFKSYSELTVTGRNLKREIPKVMKGKSSFEKRSGREGMMNKALFFFIFICLFF